MMYKDDEDLVRILMHIQTISSPLKQGTHFDQRVGGIAGLFENLRSNTQVS